MPFMIPIAAEVATAVGATETAGSIAALGGFATQAGTLAASASTGSGIMTALSAGSTIASMAAKSQEGNAARSEATRVANADAIEGKSALASGSAAAANSALGSQYALSKAESQAGASNADPNSASIINQEQRLTGQGTYNTLMQVYNGQQNQQVKQVAADTSTYEGEQKFEAGNIGAIGGLAQGGMSLYSKYYPQTNQQTA